MAGGREHPTGAGRPHPGTRARIRRTGLAGLLTAFLRPGEARAAAVTPNGLELAFPSRTATIPFRDLEATTVTYGWRRARIRFRHAGGDAAISGTNRNDARAFTTVLEARREEWWKRALARRFADIRSVHNRLAQLKDPPGYVTRRAGSDLAGAAEAAVRELPGRWPDSLSQHPGFRMLAAIRAFLEAPERFRAETNRTFIAHELVRSKELLDRIESRPLTGEQRRAVVTNEERNLVVAAAGSGKTSVIVAKAAWLIRRGWRPPELLLLAFARDARAEMETRIRKRLGRGPGQAITVRTFHSLGMAIIGEAEGRKPALAKAAESDTALSGLLNRILGDLRQDPAMADTLRTWFGSHFAPYRSEHGFENWGEYWDYIRKHDIRSLQGETVRSFEECEIANFLALNGVPYRYEAPYEHDTATSRHSQYRPDFHLPEAGIYIEHFGLDARGNTAPFVDRDEYLRSLEWKRQLHETHGTVLVETFSYEHASGTLITGLARKLAAHGVTLSPVPADRLFDALARQGRVDPFTRLVATFLQHVRGARLSFRDLERQAAVLNDGGRAAAFLAVFRPIWKRYTDGLAEAGEIDFHDMINRATDHVESGRWRSPYRYILVDEFQDISPGRAQLLKAFLDQAPETRLLAVGDDWQAIYRFGGSDIAIMREFGERFGPSERIDLETTFRCCDRIAATATGFVLKNPAQIRKSVRAIHRSDGPAVHVGLSGDDGQPLLHTAFERIAAATAGHAGTSPVLVLGRYRHARPQNLEAINRRYPGLQVRFMTVHGSKGLEADTVVVPGLCSGTYGFPSEIVDDPLLHLVLGNPEPYPNAEERRLFYVALTRARHQVFLLADGGPPSEFVRELIREHGDDIAVFGKPPDAGVACPECRTGELKRRDNPRNRGVFYGCSHWPLCEYRQRPCPHCGEGLVVRAEAGIRCRNCHQDLRACPECDGWLETRMGRYGRFLGCSNWPVCDVTRKIRK